MLSSDRNQHGFTLPEALIAGGIVLLLLGVLIQTLLPALRYSAEGTVRVELQQSGYLALRQITDDLQKTTAAGVSFQATPVAALAINSIDSIDGTGKRVWSDQVHLYGLDSPSRKLLLEPHTVTQTSLALPSLLSTSDITTLMSGTSGRERTLASNVENFEVTPYLSATATLPAQPMSVRIRLGKDLPHTAHRAQIELMRSVFLRNS